MKKVLYITNIEVPYRAKFFNELSKYCDLTVLYERERSANRSDKWTTGSERKYKAKYLNGFNMGNENTFSFKIFKDIFADYDTIIFGCYHSRIQMVAMMVLRLLRKPFVISIDGEVFAKEKNLKNSIKKIFLKGARAYLSAGEKCAETLREIVGDKKIVPYYFSSLFKDEIKSNSEKSKGISRNDTVLVIGQYYDYKGLDVAIESAKMDKSINYKFLGMGNRADVFRIEQNTDVLSNVEVISFLEKEELEKEYQNCKMIVLPSRQECWGLVVNEASSFGMPIVSTWGSGAGVEFLADNYPQFLAKSGDAKDLYEKIKSVFLLNEEDTEKYSEFLCETSEKYCIDECVKAHLEVID